MTLAAGSLQHPDKTTEENSPILFRFLVGEQELVIIQEQEDSRDLGTEIGTFCLDKNHYSILKINPTNTPTAFSAKDVGALLTGRELQIAALVAAGQSNKQAAKQLGISEWTVNSHLRRVYAKLGVDNRASMVFRCAALLDGLAGFSPPATLA